MLKLNIGCGNDYRNGFINIDRNENARCDKVVNLEEGALPFKDGSVDYILANHVLEHVSNLIPLMNEFYRVMVGGGLLHIEVPFAGTPAHWKDPTHVRGFIPQTFRYFAEWNTCPFYGVRSWELEKIEVFEDKATQENTYILCEMRRPK